MDGTNDTARTRADNDNTTNTNTASRRRMLTGTVAAAITGAMTASALAAPDDDADAKLLELARELKIRRETELAIYAEPPLPDGITPQSEDYDLRADQAHRRWWETAELILAMPATTLAGLRAKAESMRIVLEHCTCVSAGSTLEDIEDGLEGDFEHRMALSLANDLLAAEVSA